jgi:transcriptional regulator with XRE-family HTH domain
VNNTNETPATADIDEVFGSSLKYWRETLGRTQAEVTDLMNARGFTLHSIAIHRIEAGKRGVSIAEGLAFAEVLNIPLVYLTNPLAGTEPAQLLELKRTARLQAEVLEAIQTSKADLELLRRVLEQQLEDVETQETRELFAPLASPELVEQLGKLDEAIAEARDTATRATS